MAGLEQWVSSLVGAAFGIRALDARRGWLARTGYGLVAYDLIRSALQDVPSSQPASVGGQIGDSPALSRGSLTPLKFEERKVRNISERVAYVHQQLLAGVKDPKIYSLARSLVTKKCGNEWCIPERDAKGEMSALFAHVRQNVRYTWDPTTFDAFQTPRKTLELMAADCDDVTALLGALCMSVGHQVKMRVVQTRGFDTWNHIYLMAKLPGGNGWWPLDATVNRPPGWEVPKPYVVAVKDFEVTG